jgi:hypothetical protein
MNFKLSNSAGRRGAGSLLILSNLMLLPFAAMATDLLYHNTGTINNANLPQIDAITFVNSGTWNIFTSPFIYETANTLNYTNSGSMTGSPGWEFDLNPSSTGQRTNSAIFFNDVPGTIQANDGSIVNPVTSQNATTASYLLIAATNIVNKGNLLASASGEVIINGSEVNLTRSGVGIIPIVGVGSPGSPTNFTPDTAIYDEYWVGGTNSSFYERGTPWSGTTVAQFTFFNAGAPCGEFVTAQIGPLTPSIYDSNTNAFGPFQIITTNNTLLPPYTTNLVYSNIVHQAIFAYVSDPTIIPNVRFGPSLSPTNIYLPMAAQLATTSTNVTTGGTQTATIYVEDDLAAVYTNGALAKNLVIYPSAPCTDPTYRPNSVTVSRVDTKGYYSGGSAGNGPFPLPSTFFYDPASFTNLISPLRADVYSALVDNLAQEPVYGNSITNAPGRVDIYANDLNLSRVRMSAAAEIVIQASNLVSSAGASMDCQNLSYNFGSTNGSLNITNLSVQFVHRLNGTINEWSGLWTNYQVTIFPNFVTNAMATNSPFYTEMDITNVTEMDLAITVVDAGPLNTTVPVTVQDLILHSTNMVVSDVMNVASTLLFDGLSLTINGGITLSDQLQKWNSSTAPSLRYFTNNGSLSIPDTADFGDDGPTNYLAFVNTGTIKAISETISSSYFESGGSQTVSGGYSVTTTSGKVENGGIISGSGIDFTAATLKLNNATMTAGAELFLDVTGSLFDAGASSGNMLTCNNGFDLPVKPATGDLLGTELETITPMFVSVDHYWSGIDQGASPAGYNNNEAVGKLVLNEGTDSEFDFHATSTSNAIYADLLDLSQCPDFLDPDVLTIDSNFVIYYAAVKLPGSFTVPPNGSGVPQEPEEFLNGQLGGRLVWVPGYAGANSSEYCVVNGKSILVNSALRHSQIIDSNGNGIPNEFDQFPFDSPPVVLSGSIVTNNPPPAKQFAISWTAAANTVYQVQYLTNLSPANWTPLLNYTNNATTNVFVTVWDTNALSGQRYYRVSHP